MNTNLEKLIEKLFDVRIKHLTDYSIVFKYGEYRLMCCEIFCKEIIEMAKEFGIEFIEVFMFNYRNEP